MLKDDIVRKSSGILFQYFGAATVKAAYAYIDETNGTYKLHTRRLYYYGDPHFDTRGRMLRYNKIALGQYLAISIMLNIVLRFVLRERCRYRDMCTRKCHSHITVTSVCDTCTFPYREVSHIGSKVILYYNINS